MQYLKSSHYLVNLQLYNCRSVKNKPDRVQSIFQSFLFRLAFDKFLNDVQFVFATRLKSAGVVENIARMVREDEFVVDLVFATLQTRFS